MRRNPLAPLGRIFTPFIRIPARLVDILRERPVAYARVSRGLAGGIGATVGIVLTVGALVTFAIMQSLKLIGGVVWAPEQALAFIVLAALAGFLWGFGVLKMAPGLPRALLGALTVLSLVAAVLMLFRWTVGYEPFNGGATAMICAFPVAFAVVWGMGGFNPKYMTIEAVHAAAHEPHTDQPPLRGAFDGIQLNVNLVNFVRNRIVPVLRPLFGYMLVILAVVTLIIIALLIVGNFAPKRVQTENTAAAATTINGTLDGVEIFGRPVSKFVFFIVVAFLIMGALGTLALLITLTVNALSAGVSEAKKAPKKPLDLTRSAGKPGPFGGVVQFVTRLMQFLKEWIADIAGGFTGSASR
jgi:hypothetical protein